MSKYEKLIKKILQSRPISYSDAEKLLKNLGFELTICGSHHIFRKKGYSKNISIKKRPQLLPYRTCSGGVFPMKPGSSATDFEAYDDPIAAGAIGEE